MDKVDTVLSHGVGLVAVGNFVDNRTTVDVGDGDELTFEAVDKDVEVLAADEDVGVLDIVDSDIATSDVEFHIVDKESRLVGGTVVTESDIDGLTFVLGEVELSLLVEVTLFSMESLIEEAIGEGSGFIGGRDIDVVVLIGITVDHTSGVPGKGDVGSTSGNFESGADEEVIGLEGGEIGRIEGVASGADTALEAVTSSDTEGLITVQRSIPASDFVVSFKATVVGEGSHITIALSVGGIGVEGEIINEKGSTFTTRVEDEESEFATSEFGELIGNRSPTIGVIDIHGVENHSHSTIGKSSDDLLIVVLGGLLAESSDVDRDIESGAFSSNVLRNGEERRSNHVAEIGSLNESTIGLTIGFVIAIEGDDSAVATTGQTLNLQGGGVGGFSILTAGKGPAIGIAAFEAGEVRIAGNLSHHSTADHDCGQKSEYFFHDNKPLNTCRVQLFG